MCHFRQLVTGPVAGGDSQPGSATSALSHACAPAVQTALPVSATKQRRSSRNLEGVGGMGRESRPLQCSRQLGMHCLQVVALPKPWAALPSTMEWHGQPMCCRQRRGALYSGSGMTCTPIWCEPHHFQPSVSVHISTASRGSVDIGVKLLSMILHRHQAWQNSARMLHHIGLRMNHAQCGSAFALPHGRQIRGQGVALGQ